MVGKLKCALLCATLLGSLAATGARAASYPLIGAAEPSRPVTFDVILPLRNKDQLDKLLTQLHDPSSPLFHHWLSPKAFGLRFGPDSETISRVAGALTARGFTIAKTNTRSLHVIGTAGQVAAAFGAKMMLAKSDEGAIKVATADELKLPQELTDAHAQIFSFAPHGMHTMSALVGKVNPNNRYSATGGYWFDDLKQAYSYPAVTATTTVKGTTYKLDGTGATIGALMSSDILPSDITAVFENEKWSSITGLADPSITTDDLDGGGGLFGGAFAEASIDTQSEITGAPGANVILYSIPSLYDGDIINGYTTIVENNTVDIVSSSFGECELYYFPQYNGGTDLRGVLQAEHELFLQGNAQGISFFASSGDSAGKGCISASYFKPGPGKYIAGVSTPASDPAVTAVGGTNLVTGYDEGSLASPYVGENAWNDPEVTVDPYGFGYKVPGALWGAGSGYSAYWGQPSYQTLVNTGSTTARAVPDVGMHVGGCPGSASDYSHKLKECTGGKNPLNGLNDPQRSYGIFALAVGDGGGYYGFVGTSLSSPQFAGAMAPFVAINGRQGNFNNFLYTQAAKQAEGSTVQYFHTNIQGYNGVVLTDLNNAYSLSVGVGTPLVANLIGVPTAPLAGAPQTASNP